MQVCDLLMASGLSVKDRLLPKLLQFPSFDYGEMRYLSSLVQADVKAAFRELLEACFLYTHGRAQLTFDQNSRSGSTSRDTKLICDMSTRKEQTVERFYMMGGCRTDFVLTIPSQGEQVWCSHPATT